MFALFLVQLGESWLAEAGVISPEFAEAARIGVGGMFLLAAAWVLRNDLKVFTRVLRDGFRAPWSELEAPEELVH